jgi:6-pyruvoyltetrahydropterin/6-carboxytetrahydropterin synthase
MATLPGVVTLPDMAAAGEPISQPVVVVTKRVTFCAAHWYYRPDWSPERNNATFYACANRHAHGHNYELELAVAGPCQPDTGMVVNLNEVKQWLHTHVVQPLDHKNLNMQVPFFADHIPTLENLVGYIWQQLTPVVADHAGLTLHSLRLVENETLYVTALDANTMTAPTAPALMLSRRYDFSAAHRLYNPAFTDAQNEQVFGLCNNPNGHGHNYDVEITLTGQPDLDTGMLVDIVQLDDLVKREIISQVDHKHLNLDVPFFAGINPTAENIAVVFWHRLAPHFTQGPLLHRVRIIESRNNYADYYGG